jgi:regulator of sigma E protease
MVTVSYGPLAALSKAVGETWDKSTFTLLMIGKMITGEVSWRNISGPVTIADYAGRSARLGVDYYIKFLALVSISLGVLNLLPIPILDGGICCIISSKSSSVGQFPSAAWKSVRRSVWHSCSC